MSIFTLPKLLQLVSPNPDNIYQWIGDSLQVLYASFSFIKKP